MACRFDPCQPHHVGASYILLAPIFVCKNQSVAICRCSSLFAKGHIRVGYSVASALINAFGSLPTFCESACGANISMVRQCQIGMDFVPFRFLYKENIYINSLTHTKWNCIMVAPKYNVRYRQYWNYAPKFDRRSVHGG